MQNMKSYFSSWKPFWKSSRNSSYSKTLKLSPSNINFTNSSLGDLKTSIIDEKLMIDISTKLIQSISPPKLQICAHNNQWFALNNSHLLVYRQLERIGLCDTVVCDIIRSQDVPIGIRQTLIPVVLPQLEQKCNGNRFISRNGKDVQNQDEIMYCADIQADSCGCLDNDDDSLVTDGESDDDDDDDDEDSYDEQIESSTNTSLIVAQISTISNNQFDEIDLDDDGIEDSHKEMQSLL